MGKNIAWYMLNRIRDSAITLVLASVLGFLVMRVLPGDPARLIVGPFATPVALANARESLGTNLPLYEQYGSYAKSVLTGDWGFSHSIGLDVKTAFLQHLPATLELALYAIALSVGGGVVAAVLASHAKRRWRRTVDFVCLVNFGLPPFWLGLILILVFSVGLGILPGPSGRLSPGVAPPADLTGLYTVDALVSGQMGVFWDAARHLVLPTLALAAIPWAFVVRLLAANMEQTANAPFVLVARSRGKSSWSTHLVHVLPNSVLSTVSSSGLIFAQLITGSVLVETTFNWPGIGLLLTRGIGSQDYILIQTFILLSAVFFVVGNLAADLVNGFLDPRVRAKEKSKDPKS